MIQIKMIRIIQMKIRRIKDSEDLDKDEDNLDGDPNVLDKEDPDGLDEDLDYFDADLNTFDEDPNHIPVCRLGLIQIPIFILFGICIRLRIYHVLMASLGCTKK